MALADASVTTTARASPRNLNSLSFRIILHLQKPSLAFEAYRDEIRRIVETNRGLNPRVFGSVLHGEDTEESNLDILIDAAPRFTPIDQRDERPATLAVDIEALHVHAVTAVRFLTVEHKVRWHTEDKKQRKF